ncbi:MAG: UDP-N-acetylmuramoyl-tripeptide--D-alanyl-D-alanine ligase [Candidatus Omnitrophica bacterium]|nr:UDP-N-acetylmuramoyl-tripeptide--D-alanyl-D-alanine ligase [Candidatus Omnitrophota bacterium]MDD5488023.1 UDP-N-acetylmuramoyl-tripeptide--D-alanyl-D-alanine ligase [Candidatus Omnitrophota bacterium]
MIGISLKEAASIAGGRILSGTDDLAIKGVSTDSRAVRRGDLFIAIRGRNYDGHDFIGEAVISGAGCVMAEEVPRLSCESRTSIPILIVDDTLEAMSRLAHYVRSRAKALVIAVTGTNGKTSVKDMIHGILSTSFRAEKSKASYNNIVGVTRTLFDLDEGCEVLVCEIGTNNKGEIAALADVAEPDIAVITNIGRGHLEGFGDRKGVFEEKISILRHLAGRREAFINGDDDLLGKVPSRTGGITMHFFGEKENNDFIISDVEHTPEGCMFKLNGMDFSAPVFGRHNIYNAAAAISVAMSLGVTCEAARAAIKDVRLPGMRLERMRVGPALFINDAYNANPDSFMSALDVLENTECEGCLKGVVAGQMLELGEGSRRMHSEVGENVAARKVDFLITVGKEAGYIAEGARVGGMAPDRVFAVPGHADAARTLMELGGGRNIVLVKGSRGARMEEVIKCFTTYCIR